MKQWNKENRKPSETWQKTNTQTRARPTKNFLPKKSRHGAGNSKQLSGLEHARQIQLKEGTSDCLKKHRKLQNFSSKLMVKKCRKWIQIQIQKENTYVWNHSPPLKFLPNSRWPVGVQTLLEVTSGVKKWGQEYWKDMIVSVRKTLVFQFTNDFFAEQTPLHRHRKECKTTFDVSKSVTKNILWCFKSHLCLKAYFEATKDPSRV